MSSRRSESEASSATTSPASVHRALVPRDAREGSGPLRTLNDVRQQVSQEIAVSCVLKGEMIDGVRTGVYISMGSQDEKDLLDLIAASISGQLRLSSYLFVLVSAINTIDPVPSSLVVTASSDDLVQRGILLVSSKFTGRIVSSTQERLKQWSARIEGLGASIYDEKALWDVVRKAARQPINPLLPPPGSRGIDQILEDARAKLLRITATEAFRELEENQIDAPTFLVDIRPSEQRKKHGGIRGSLVIERNVLEWRLDPRSDARLAVADRYDLRVIVFCQEGYTSSLAAYSLQQLGLLNATDIVGGFEAWKRAGLPIDVEIESVEPRSLASLAGSVV